MPAWGFPAGAASGLILPEDTGALLGLEWQQAPALAASLLISGGQTEARSSAVASCKPLLPGFLPRGVEAALLACLAQATHPSLPVFSSLVAPGTLCEDQSSSGLQWQDCAAPRPV